MNELAQAMFDLAAVRDRLVLQTLAAAVVVLCSHAVLRSAFIPPRIRDAMVNVQLGLFLAIWIGMLIVIGGIG